MVAINTDNSDRLVLQAEGRGGVTAIRSQRKLKTCTRLVPKRIDSYFIFFSSIFAVKKLHLIFHRYL